MYFFHDVYILGKCIEKTNTKSYSE